MLTSLVLGAALAAPAAPVPRDTRPAPAGPAPWTVYLKADDGGRVNLFVHKYHKVTQTRVVTTVENGKPVVKQVQQEVDRLVTSSISLDGLPARYTTAHGAVLSPETVLKRAKDGVVVLVSADGKPVESGWLRAVDPDTIVVVADGLAGPIAPRPVGPVATPAPRLTLFATGADGKIRVAFNPAASGANTHSMLALGGRAVFINNGAGNQLIVLKDDGSFAADVPPASADPPVKPLEDVNFDAFDLGGKVVGREAVFKRLKAGGMVLIAGDNRVPDPVFLKQFRGDLLVLAASELVNVPVKGLKPGVVLPIQAMPLVAPAAAAARVRLLALPAQAVPVPAQAQAVPIPVKAVPVRAVPVPPPVGKK